MPKWKVERTGPEWLMDAIGRVIGFKDRRGGEYHIPSIAASAGDAESYDDPRTAGTGSGTVDAAGVLSAMQAFDSTQKPAARTAMDAASALAPLDLTSADFTAGNLNLTSTHANRLVRINVPTNVTVTFQSDSTMGTSGADEFFFLQAGAGTITRAVSGATFTAPNGWATATSGDGTSLSAVRKAANAWASTQPASSSSQNRKTGVNSGPPSALIPIWGSTTTFQLGLANSGTFLTTATGKTPGATAYSKKLATRYTAAAGTNSRAGVLVTNAGGRAFDFEDKYHKIVVQGGVGDAFGLDTRMFIGLGDNSLSFSSGQPTDNFQGWRIGVGWRSTDDNTTNKGVQLIVGGTSGATAPSVYSLQALSGTAWNIPTTADSWWGRLEIEYFPSTDAGGRRMTWTFTEEISGQTTSGTVAGGDMPTEGGGITAGYVVQRNGALGGTEQSVVDVGVCAANAALEWTQ